MALKRLQKELKDLLSYPVPFGTVEPTDNPLIWKAYLNGPVDTPYENGVFELELKFSNDYPNRVPAVRFITNIFHANINQNSGHICLSLMAEWRPTDTVTTVLIALNNLLADPNMDDSPYKTFTKDQYNEEAKRWTQTHAIKH